MSLRNPHGQQIELPRHGANHFWEIVQKHYAGSDQRCWRYLAILALRENAGWPLEQIGQVFGHPKGHVTRILRKVKQELKDRFRPEPEEPAACNETDW